MMLTVPHYDIFPTNNVQGYTCAIKFPLRTQPNPMMGLQGFSFCKDPAASRDNSDTLGWKRIRTQELLGVSSNQLCPPSPGFGTMCIIGASASAVATATTARVAMIASNI